MTIIHIVEPFATGINTFIHELVAGMPNDQHIIIHGERDDNRKLQSIMDEYGDNVKFVRWKNAQRELRFLKDLKSFLSLRKLLKNNPFDIIHLHSSKAGAIGGFWSFIKGRKNVVYTPNAVSFLRTDVPQYKVKIFKFIEQCISRFGVNIVSCSPSEHQAYKKIGIESRIIRNGVTIAHNNEEKPKQANKVFTVVINGKITTQKNPSVVNEIVKHFENDASISFNWIGDGELRHILNSSKINILGWCNKKEVFNHLEKADLFLSASLWEGLPLSCIEAMFFKLPLLLKQSVGNIDLVNEGKNGYSFNTVQEAVEHINILKNNPQQLALMSENAEKTYENYSNYRCAKEYRDLYNELIRGKTK